MKHMTLDAVGRYELAVTDGMTAKACGSGTLDVLSTPMMIAAMEAAAIDTLHDGLDEGETTVGISINVRHMWATPVGKTIRAEAKLVGIDETKRRFMFEVDAYCGDTKIGSGLHERCVVNEERFLSKINA